MTLVFAVAEGGVARAGQTLERYPHNPLAPIDRARAHLDEPRTPPTLREACSLLGVDLLLLVRLERPGLEGDEKPTRLVGWLYDARPDKILKRAEEAVGADPNEAAAALARALVTDVPLDGTVAPPPPTAPRRASWAQRFAAGTRRDLSRFYHWKGFWYVAGGVAGLVAAGIAGGVGGAYAQEQQEHQRLARQRANGVILIGGN
jgi:hypothetical protein